MVFPRKATQNCHALACVSIASIDIKFSYTSRMWAWSFAALYFAWVQPAPRVGAPMASEDFMEPMRNAGARFVHTDPLPVVRSKKRLWREEKQRRPQIRVTDEHLAAVQAKAKRPATAVPGPASSAPQNQPLTLPPVGSRIAPITTIFSVHLREALPLLPGVNSYPAFKNLLRDHYSNQATEVDPALLDAITRAALKFKSTRVELVSGYRSPKYNLSLRKKGHQVAQTSQHCEGKAADFRLRGVSTNDLWAFIKGLKLGGVGIYPQSAFVHCDTGPVRFWKGD